MTKSIGITFTDETPLDTWLAEIGPEARLVSVEESIAVFTEHDSAFTTAPVCHVSGEIFDIAHFERGERPHRSNEVSYQWAVIRFDSPGYEPGSVLGDSEKGGPCSPHCLDDAKKRLLKDRVAVAKQAIAAAETAIRLIPVTDETVRRRARAIALVSDLVEVDFATSDEIAGRINAIFKTDPTKVTDLLEALNASLETK